MKKVISLFAVMAFLVCVVQIARSLGVPPTPPGISANDWIPLGDAAGFVITHDSSGLTPLKKSDEVRGYFVVRPANRWLRVDTQPQLDRYPAVQAQ